MLLILSLFKLDGKMERLQICVGVMLSWLVSKVCGTKVCGMLLYISLVSIRYMLVGSSGFGGCFQFIFYLYDLYCF